MNDFPPDEPHYTRIVAAQLANISIEILERCEMERLVRVRVIREGTPGYNARDVRQLARIRRLHRELGLDFLEGLEIASAFGQLGRDLLADGVHQMVREAHA